MLARIVLCARLTWCIHRARPDPTQPFYSYLLSASQSGYTPNGAGGYISKSLPPIDFTYTER
jgi:hypothetical protein